MNKRIIFGVVNDWSVKTVSSHSSGLFFTSQSAPLSLRPLSLSVAFSPLITKVLFIVAPIFSLSSLFFLYLSEHELQYLSLSVSCMFVLRLHHLYKNAYLPTQLILYKGNWKHILKYLLPTFMVPRG